MYSEALQTQVSMTTNQLGESKCCDACLILKLAAWFSLGPLWFSHPCSVVPETVSKTNFHSVIIWHLLLCFLVFAVPRFPPEMRNKVRYLLSLALSWMMQNGLDTLGAISSSHPWSQQWSTWYSSMAIQLSAKVYIQTCTKLVRKGLHRVFLA